jgi:hypothetical protein
MFCGGVARRFVFRAFAVRWGTRLVEHEIDRLEECAHRRRIASGEPFLEIGERHAQVVCQALPPPRSA